MSKNSLITPDMVAVRSRFGSLAWTEINTQEQLLFSASHAGKTCLNRYLDGQITTLNGAFPVGGTIGYGGGDFGVCAENGIFVSRPDRLVRFDAFKIEAQILPLPSAQFASPTFSPDGRTAAVIRSDGTTDAIHLINLSTESEEVWIQGADFYMQPIFSPEGRFFAWTQWNHPHMAWDASCIFLAHLNPQTLEIIKIEKIAGEEGCAAHQPAFSADGKTLSFILADGDGDSLALFDLESGERRKAVSFTSDMLAPPAFAYGLRTYAWFPDNRRIVFMRFSGAESHLCIFDRKNSSAVEVLLPGYTIFDQVCVAPQSGAIAVFASGPRRMGDLLLIQGTDTKIIYALGMPDFPYAQFAEPQKLEWHTADEQKIYGLFYEAQNLQKKKPPLIIAMHSGPTGRAENRFNAEIAYFNSIGFSWLEVNYRGSFGYGYSYLRALYGNWGVTDTDDAASAAQMAIQCSLASPESGIFILGGSAGGFSALNALRWYPHLFTAGIVRYPVVDLLASLTDTHKMELHYTELLVGQFIESDPKYVDRSPISHAESFTKPLLIFHGEDDQVVPVLQVQAFVERLQGDVTFRLYSSEGHGFRMTETIADYLHTVCSFLCNLA